MFENYYEEQIFVTYNITTSTNLIFCIVRKQLAENEERSAGNFELVKSSLTLYSQRTLMQSIRFLVNDGMKDTIISYHMISQQKATLVKIQPIRKGNSVESR